MDNELQPAPRRGSGRVPPHNLEAEESLLGAMMLSRDAIRVAEATVTEADFYKPAHATIFLAIMLTYGAGPGDEPGKVDPVTVSDTLRSSDELAGIGGRQALLRIQGATPASANARHYAKIVSKLAAHRRAIRFAGDLAELGYDDSDEDSVDRLVELAHAIGDRISVPNQTVEAGIDVTALAEMTFDYKWLVPGLIRRLDRIIVTGLEGFSGKTEFIFQLAVQFASGVHPWTRNREFAPLRVTYVDFENALDQLHPRAQRLVKAAGEDLYAGQLTVRALPQGINLRNARGLGWLDAVCEQEKPDVLITGPIYRMFEGERGAPKHSEEVAEDVTQRLRRLTVRHDCALILEAHAPHGTEGDRANLRPYGASLWMRWPEIGVGLAPMKRRDSESRRLVVVPGKFSFDFWRGTRDQDLRRPWPSGVERSRPWSFVPTDDSEVM